MSHSMRVLGALLAAVALWSCAHSKADLPPDESGSDYLIGREDLLDVSVWREPELSRSVPVRPDGKISLPLAGELEAAGRTTHQVAREVAERIAPYVQDPRVVVIVHEANASRVYVVGEVARPGAYPLRGRLTVLQALSLAGGPSEFASRGSIVVLRGVRGERYRVDWADLVSRERGADFPLAPGDTIVVP